MPPEFVPLTSVAPDVAQDMRYATSVNFLGRPVRGYHSGTCIVRRRTALALAAASAALRPQGYGLKVYDCYRPVRAVRDLVRYAETGAAASHSVYHPTVPRRALLAEGYVARQSGHSTGLAVDVTLFHLAARPQPPPERAVCGGPRLPDEADMGTGYDCFDPAAWIDARTGAEAAANRMRLKSAMEAAGFRPYAREWWHFSLPPRDEAERRPFDFPVRAAD
jgi:D-alanyl-D-alanine dipeptidase